MAIRTLTPGTVSGGGTQVRGYELDLAGSGGTLSNGTVTIAGYTWTVYGVGTAAEAGIIISPSDFLGTNSNPEYDGATDTLEACVAITVQTMGQQFGVTGMQRYNSTTNAFNFAIQYIVNVGTVPYQQTGVSVDGSATTVQQQATVTLRQLGLQMTGASSVSSIGSSTSLTPFRTAENYNGPASFACRDGAQSYSQVFSTSDLLILYGRVYSGTTTHSIVQDASGITITSGSQVTTFRKLFVYLGTNEVTS